MKTVLILANNDIGLYNFRKELIEKLLEKNFEVAIALPYGKKVDRLIQIGCTYYETPIDRHGTNPITDMKLLQKYKKIMREYKPDVVLTYTIKPTIYGGMACQKLNIPYIANITGLGTAVENPGIMQKITVALYKKAFQSVHCVFFQNKENKQFFAKRQIANDKHRLIPGSGVNLEHFSLLPYPPDDTIEFLFIARVMKEKGIDQYLEAAEIIREKYPYTRFHVLGFCEEAYEDILKAYEARGMIQYHGLQEDVRVFHQRSHCTIHPSYYPEGMSNVLLESEACGRPVITTNRSGCGETMEDGRTGFLFKAKNTESLVKAIEKFLALTNEERRQMGLNGRQKVEQEFDRQIVVDAYMEEIEKILINKNKQASNI